MSRSAAGEEIAAAARMKRSMPDMGGEAFAWRNPLLAAVAAIAATALAGCGASTATLDVTGVEHAIAASILAQRHLVVGVVCPSKVPRKPGAHFDCAAILQVGTYPVAVSETSNAGHVIYANPTPLIALNTAKVQQAIASSIRAQRHASATVQCPSQVLQQAELVFTCAATFNGATRQFVVTQVDGAGSVLYSEHP